MCTFEKECTFGKVGEQCFDFILVETGTDFTAKPVNDPFDILCSLQPPDEPGADIGKSLVVEINRVLCTEYHSYPKCTCLFEQ